MKIKTRGFLSGDSSYSVPNFNSLRFFDYLCTNMKGFFDEGLSQVTCHIYRPPGCSAWMFIIRQAVVVHVRCDYRRLMRSTVL